MRSAHMARAITDGGWTLFDWDAATGRTTWVTTDDKGNTVFRYDMPVAATIEDNTAARNAVASGWKGDWHRIASVPMQLLYDKNLGLNEAVLQGDDAHVRRFLNDSDNRAWRTKEGRV